MGCKVRKVCGVIEAFFLLLESGCKKMNINFVMVRLVWVLKC